MNRFFSFLSSSTLFKLGFILIILLGVLTRFSFLGRFNHPIFDEVYYSTMTTQYLSGISFIDSHPPTARFAFAILAALGGASGADRFETSDVPYGDFPYVLLRLGSAFAGVLLIIFLMLLAKEITRSRVVALLTGFLMVFENSFIVESRYMLGDIFIFIFGIMALWAFFRKDRFPMKSGGWYRWLALSGILFGLSMGAKVSGIVFLVVAWFAYIRASGWSRKSWKTPVMFLGIIPFVTIFILMFVHFSLFSPEAPVHYVLGVGKEPIVPLFEDFRDHNIFLKFGSTIGLIGQRFIEAFLGSMLAFVLHWGTFGGHPSASPWWSWPFMETPMLFSGEPVNGVYQIIHLFGNPFIWWGGIIAMAFLLVRYFGLKSFRHIEPLLFGYWINLIILAFVTRELFMYLYMPSLLFLIILTAVALREALRMRPFFGAAFLLFVVAGFIFFSPFTYGLPISDSALQLRLWLPYWNPLIK